MTQSPEQNPLRRLPSLDELLRHAVLAAFASTNYRPLLVEAARATLESIRAEMRAGAPPVSHEEIAWRVRAAFEQRQQPSLRPIINATGVILNTNLGRAPLSQAALAAINAVAQGYSNLEYDLQEGERGSRHTHVRALLKELTGAEDALVTNNNAAAVLLVLSTLAAGHEVIISRGELVEIGGGFRVPDILRQSGAQLVEVGTTNRTRLRDYEQAITDKTALLLRVHPSNFSLLGFTEATPLDQLVQLAHSRNLPVVEDLGSGCLLETTRYGLAHEPTPQESIAAGADVVCFSGDKLLGGPQAGIIVGRHQVLARIAQHPLMRAVRIDKLTLAALEATLRHYQRREADEHIPIWRMIATPLEALRQRTERWTAELHCWGLQPAIIEGQSTIGGGSLPGEMLPTLLLSIPKEALPSFDQKLQLPAANDLPSASGQQTKNSNSSRVATLATLEQAAASLRTGTPPVVARLSRERLLLDPRTILPEQDEALLQALHSALGVIR
ncbi:MAG TPA: L-seryl-tRNA(Sec) selenium transferase [Ktedonobacterales bacterium]|jgi:L-seryl-tRNA(Ser) seleniumtransferase